MHATAVLRQLKRITMNIFTKSTAEADFARTRISRHYDLKGLESRGVEYAEVKRVLFS